MTDASHKKSPVTAVAPGTECTGGSHAVGHGKSVDLVTMLNAEPLAISARLG